MNNFNISNTFKGVSNTLQNFTFMGATVLEIAGGPADPPLVKGVGTKRLSKGRVKVIGVEVKYPRLHQHYKCTSLVLSSY